VGHVVAVADKRFEVDTGDTAIALNIGDALTWWDQQGELQGVPVNTAARVGRNHWRVETQLRDSLQTEPITFYRRKAGSGAKLTGA